MITLLTNLFRPKLETGKKTADNRLATIADVNAVVKDINSSQGSYVNVTYELFDLVDEAVVRHIQGTDSQGRYENCECSKRNRRLWLYTGGEVGCINCTYALNLAKLIILGGGHYQYVIPPPPPGDPNPPIGDFTVRFAFTSGGGLVNYSVEKTGANTFDIFTYNVAAGALEDGHLDGVQIVVTYYYGTATEGPVS